MPVTQTPARERLLCPKNSHHLPPPPHPFPHPSTLLISTNLLQTHKSAMAALPPTPQPLPPFAVWIPRGDYYGFVTDRCPSLRTPPKNFCHLLPQDGKTPQTIYIWITTRGWDCGGDSGGD